MSKAKKKCRTCNLGAIISGGNKTMKKLKLGKFNMRPIKQGVYGGALCKAIDEAVNFIEGKKGLNLTKPLPAEAVLIAPVGLSIVASMLLKPKAGSALDDAITGAVIVGTGKIIDYAWDLGKSAVSGYPSMGVGRYPYNGAVQGYPSMGVGAYPFNGNAAGNDMGLG